GGTIHVGGILPWATSPRPSTRGPMAAPRDSRRVSALETVTPDNRRSRMPQERRSHGQSTRSTPEIERRDRVFHTLLRGAAPVGALLAARGKLYACLESPKPST